MLKSKNRTNPFIGFAGNIGSGKTTFTTCISDRQQWEPFYEPVSENPYLNDFYKDMTRWSFNLQIYFLHKRFRIHQEMSKINKGKVQDRTIYEDKEIFAKNLYDMGNMTERDWENYCGLFSTMEPFLQKPDLIIYLKTSTDILLSRIKKRNRDFEKSIDSEYLHKLNISYDKWIDNEKRYPVLIIETDTFDIFEDKEKFYDIENKILDKI